MTPEKIQKLGPNQRKWLKALESGKYKQGQYCLRTKDNKFCCLGVGAELFKAETTKIKLLADGEYSYSGTYGPAPEFVVRALALRDNCGTPASSGEALTSLNDGGTRFKTIAALVRKSPGNFFKRTQ